ncbi:unnamed protein product [Fraxinus pennsylvanica]|uniref:DUF4283 domain-containing protein n=1 Tax=Fraxinus pennsylvanica TaxID=56036 RepID=A0AAD2A3J8_9LAMI|nr:unnamed protein product [Fraxinus pennsylvanica]
MTSKLGQLRPRSYVKVLNGSQANDLDLETFFSLDLNYIKPFYDNGGVKVVPPIDVAVSGCEMWKTTLVSSFVGKKLAFPVVNSIAHKLWDRFGLKDILSLDTGFYVFKFDSLRQALFVIERAPW